MEETSELGAAIFRVSTGLYLYSATFYTEGSVREGVLKIFEFGTFNDTI